MTNTELRRFLRKIRELCAELELTIETPAGPKPRAIAARDRLTEQADNALPSSSSGGRGKGSHSDPTLRAVVDDRAQAEAARIKATRAELDDSIGKARLFLERAAHLTEYTLITRHHAPRNNPGCRNCARVIVDGKPHSEAWQEVKARGLCGWCYRFQYGDGESRPGYGVEPVLELVRWHLDHLGTEAPRALVRDLMPEAARARELRKKRPGICHHPTGKAGEPCALPFMHDGICTPASELEAAS